MPHLVARHFDESSAALLGLPQGRTLGDRVHLETAKLLLERRAISATGLAIAMRQAADWGRTLAQTLIAARQIDVADYYRAVADVYGVPYVDLKAEPVDETLRKPTDRAAHLAGQFVPWRRVDGRVLLATSVITADTILWANEHYGEDGYDFVIVSPFDITW